MARKYVQKSNAATYGKAFKKTSSKGKFRKGTYIKYKYVNGRRVGAVKSSGKR